MCCCVGSCDVLVFLLRKLTLVCDLRLNETIFKVKEEEGKEDTRSAEKRERDGILRRKRTKCNLEE